MLGGVPVPNQAPPLINYNLFETDLVLCEGLRRECASWAEAAVSNFGRLMGAEDTIRWGFQANQSAPVLHTHDRFGNRIDEVEFHPAWHNLMRISIGSGVHCSPWREPRDGAHVGRAAKMALMSQAEFGHGCPISMTYSAFPALQRQPDLLEQW